jgi:hypothetical protein
MNINHCLNFLDFSNLEGQVSVLISRRNRIGQLYQHALGLTKTPQVEVEVKLRPMVSRPVYLGVELPSATQDQSFVSD